VTPDWSEVQYTDAGKSNTGKSTPQFESARAKAVGERLVLPDEWPLSPGEDQLTVSDTMAGVRDWGLPPRARLLPRWRDTVRKAWEPGAPFTVSTDAMKSLDVGAHDFVPRWEYATLGDAQLWYVGAAMCDLLDGAAPGLPPTELTASVMPDECGFVLFEAPLAGIDANGSGNAVSVGAYLWGRARWRTPQGKERPVLGVTIYGPSGGLLAHEVSPVMMIPLGGLIWPFGESCDFVAFDGGARDESMQEDRRRLLALWLLSAQPSLTSNVLAHQSQVTSKAKAKRLAAGKARRDPPVRVLQLRRQPKPDAGAPERTEGGRTFRHRWTVSGHWRNQAFGPAYSKRRPTYINPYLKGPDNAPLLKGERVKSWVK
jgi:hypothetical protein